MALVRSLCALLCALLTGSAWASGPLWGYVDGQGVAHVASTRVDARYSRLGGNADADGEAVRVPGKTDRAASLLTRIDIDPQARALRPWLREASRLHGVDESLLMALIAVESGFNAAAVSPRGAVGLMQIMPSAGQRFIAPGGNGQPIGQRLLDPRTNILTGSRMLADLMRRFGRVELALAAWNAGAGAVHRAGRALPPYAETQAHVHFVLELYWSLLQQDQARRATHLRLAQD